MEGGGSWSGKRKKKGLFSTDCIEGVKKSKERGNCGSQDHSCVLCLKNQFDRRESSWDRGLQAVGVAAWWALR